MRFKLKNNVSAGERWTMNLFSLALRIGFPESVRRSLEEKTFYLITFGSQKIALKAFHGLINFSGLRTRRTNVRERVREPDSRLLSLEERFASLKTFVLD